MERAMPRQTGLVASTHRGSMRLDTVQWGRMRWRRSERAGRHHATRLLGPQGRGNVPHHRVDVSLVPALQLNGAAAAGCLG